MRARLETMSEPALSDEQRSQLEQYAAAVRASPHNLLSARALEELEERHIAESLLFAAGLPAGPARVLDLGTGGGLPGLVIAVARRDLAVTLLDATAKKVAFVAETAALMDVPVETLHGRAEDLAGEHASSFDMVVARAVAPLDRLVGWAVPFLTPGGVLHAIKGQRWSEELAAAAPLIARLGCQVVGVPSSTDGPESDTPTAPRVVSIAVPR